MTVRGRHLSAGLRMAPALALSLCAAAPQAAAQPIRIDYAVVSAIKEEGLRRSQVMATAAALTDGIGPRLTGSPGFDRARSWAIERLRAVGVSAHAEAWGPFGASWEEVRTSVSLSGSSPQTFVARATPWSPPTDGPVEAEVMQVPRLTAASQFDAWKGRLRGRIVLYGETPPDDPDAEHGRVRLTPEQIAGFSQRRLTTRSNRGENLRYVLAARFDGEVARFFASEGVRAVLRSNGFAQTFVDDESATFGFDVYKPQRRQPLPSAVMEADGYGRLVRLAASGAAPRVRMEVVARFATDAAPGVNVIGDLDGVEPAFSGQVVMVGAHLDSWAAATGATDDGAGVAIELEAFRILHAVGYRPRRPLRIGLWGGEEEGELGSRAYAAAHLATVTAREGPPDAPESLRPALSWTPLSGHERLSAYFNMDGGGGRVLGLATDGDDGAARVFRTWIEPLADLGVTVVSPRAAEGVDRISFSDVGIPAFDVVQDLRDYDARTHHTNLDSYPRLSEPDMKQAATTLAVLLYEAAEADAPLPRRGVRPTPASGAEIAASQHSR